MSGSGHFLSWKCSLQKWRNQDVDKQKLKWPNQVQGFQCHVMYDNIIIDMLSFSRHSYPEQLTVVSAYILILSFSYWSPMGIKPTTLALQAQRSKWDTRESTFWALLRHSFLCESNGGMGWDPTPLVLVGYYYLWKGTARPSHTGCWWCIETSSRTRIPQWARQKVKQSFN